MNLIAFDLGGSGGKLFLGNYTGGQLKIDVLHQFEHSAISAGGHLFWNLMNIYQEMLSGISKALRQTNDQIASLGIDSFCNDFALLTPDGELLTQLRCYRDVRMLELKDEIYRIMGPSELYQITGNQNAPFNTLMQLASMTIQGQDGLLRNNKLLFLPDLLIYFLSGQMQTEYTLASVSQMFDYKTQNWSNEILTHYQIPRNLFSAIALPGTISCQTDSFTNQQLHTKGFPIATVCEHDTASAFLASAYGKGCAIISCGTWSLVGMETNHPIVSDYGYHYNIANEGSLPGHYRILRNVMGTWLLQELRADYRSQGHFYSFAEMEQEAAGASPFKWLIDVDDTSFYSPGNMISKIQSYCQNIYCSAPNTVGALVRCIYESLAMKYRWNLEVLETLAAISFEKIQILGGGSQSSLLCQFTANAIGLPVIAGPVEATALGNMLAQLMALGQISTIEEGKLMIQRSIPTAEYLPLNQEDWNTQYAIFKTRFHLERRLL